MSFLLTALLAVTGTVTLEPEPPVYLPLDLTAIMNKDPLDAAAFAPDGQPLAEIPYTFIEAERAFRAEGATPSEREDASAGSVLTGFTERDDFAEWAFDLPFDSDETVVYLRVLPPDAPPVDPSLDLVTVFASELNERPGGVVYAPSSIPPEGVILQTELGTARMGRQLLRLRVRMAGAPVAVDCLWIGLRPLDIRNQLADSGRIHPPFSATMLVFEPGRLMARDIPFDLADPAANEGRAVVMPGPEGVTVPLEGKVGDELLLLGAGRGGEAAASMTIHYQDGHTEETSVRWPSLYSRRILPADEITVPMGQFRRAAVRRVPLQRAPVTAVTLHDEASDRVLLFAATLVHTGEN